MKCPRCDNQVLDEKDRDGVVVDVCRKCRGIWLDRGELEKLIARATSDDRRDDDDDDDDDDRRISRDRGDRGDRDDERPVGRKRRWYESFGDIFD